MNVDILRDSANTRSQRRRNLKGEGYTPFAFEVAFGCQGDRPMSVDMLPDEANTCSQQRSGFKGEGYISEYKRF